MKRQRKPSRTMTHAGSAAGALFLFAVLAVSSSHALPQSGTVVAGSASISQPSATSLNILQSSGNAIINWQGFSIGAAESVTYVQPDSSSIVLNRVSGADPSQIYGLLKGNGQVWVINPNGLLVGAGATVQTGGFLASTMNISNDSFMSGAFKFTSTPGSLASIVNQGSITSDDGGYVLLSAPTVLNSGSIVANKGTVHLASGDVITFSIDNGSLINVAVSGDVAAQAHGITNGGAITADGGQVVLTARVADDALRNIVNNEGIIEAKSIIEKDGIIILDGGDHGITANSGTLDASGKNSDETGGSVTILGAKVGLFSGSLVDVSGDAGGGTALIGGNFHGAGQERNAAMTYVDKDASIIANALGNGRGGSVAVWADDATRFYGVISAKGGAHGGDGGFVEVSGKHSLTYAGLTNVESLSGTTGTLLLDPDEITIVHGSTDSNIAVSGTDPFTDLSSGGGSTISDGTINTQLGTANVIITTSTESLTSNTDVFIDINSKILTLDSAKNITLGGTFNDTGSAGTLELKIGQAGTGGTITISNEAVINTQTVNITGGTGTDTLAGRNAATTWNITGANAVTLNSMNATGIEALVGGSGSDTFILNSGVSSFNGSISGGAGANSLAATNGANTWQMSAENTGTLNGTTAFSGIATLAGGSGSDTLICSAQTYLLNNTVANKGSNGVVNSWTSIENLTDLGAGIFKFGTAGSVTGGISAVDGTFDYSARTTTVTVNLGGTGTSGVGGGWNGITTVIGSSSTSDTITGANQVYTLDYSIANKGSNGTVSWSKIEHLTDTGTGIFNMGAGGSVSGNINGGTSGTLNYGDYSSNVTLNLTGTGTTGIGGAWSKIATVTGNSAYSNTVTGANKTYTLDNSTPDKGSSGSVTWTDFKNITDSGAGIFNMGYSGIITGTINGGTKGTLDFSSYTSPVTLDLGGSGTTGIGGAWNGITTVKGNVATSNTVTGFNKTYTLNNNIKDSGSDGTVTWSAFKNIIDTGTGIFNMGTGGSVSGNINGGTDGTLNYESYNNNVILNLAGTGTTGIGGTWSGISTVTAKDTNSNSIIGSNKIYHLDNDMANRGSDGLISWSSFNNIIDTGSGTFNMGTSGSVSGNLNGGSNGTLNFSTYGNDVTLDLSGTNTTGIGGAWSGITTVTGNAAKSNTVVGLSKTYALDNSITNKGSDGTVTWTAFKNITDIGTGTFNMGTSGNITGNLNGGTSGILYYGNFTTPVVLNLAGTGTSSIGGTWSGISRVTGNSAHTNTVIGLNKSYNLDNTTANKGSDSTITWTEFKNITDTGSGIFNMGTNGSITGNLNGGTSGTLNYGSYGSNVTVNLNGTNTSGIGGTWSGITTITGSTASDTITSSGATYHLTAANTGNNGTISWTSFENLYDTAAAIFRFTSDGSLSGSITATDGTLDYSARTSAIDINLLTHKGTAIGGTWTGISTVIGSAQASDIITGSDQSFYLTGDNAVNNGSISWTSFENIIASGTNSYFGYGGSLSGSITDTGSSTTLQGNIRTGGDQVYNGAVTLAGAATLTSTGSGAITFAGTLNSDATPRDLTITTSGMTTLGGVVGASPLKSLTVNAGGTTRIDGGSITTNGASGQVYGNSVVLGNDTSLNSGSGAITFAGTLDGAQALSLSAGSGDITFADAAGAATRLNAVTITSAGNVTIANIAATSLTQTAGSGSTMLNGVVDTTTGAGISISSNGSITANGALFTAEGGPVTLTTGSSIFINDAITSSGPIILTAGGAITEGNNGSLSTTGLLTTRSNSGQVLIGNGSNSIAGINAVNSNSGDIILTNSATPLAISGLNQSGGDLVITNSGEITGSVPITVSGATTITAPGKPITLINAGNDFTGTVTATGAATQISDMNDLKAVLNTTGPTTLLAGTDIAVSGVSTSSVTATAAGQVTLADPAAAMLAITGTSIVGTMNNTSPLNLDTRNAQTFISVVLTGNQTFLNLVGDVTSNIKGLGTYNGGVVAGSELENYKAPLGQRAATIASALNAPAVERVSNLSRFDNYFTIMSRDSIMNYDDAVRSPETDPILIDHW